jgi:hypothetical protein
MSARGPAPRVGGRASSGRGGGKILGPAPRNGNGGKGASHSGRIPSSPRSTRLNQPTSTGAPPSTSSFFGASTPQKQAASSSPSRESAIKELLRSESCDEGEEDLDTSILSLCDDTDIASLDHKSLPPMIGDKEGDNQTSTWSERKEEDEEEWAAEVVGGLVSSDNEDEDDDIDEEEEHRR